jgi:hypothetical protein
MVKKKKENLKENSSYILPSDNDELKLFIEKYKVDMTEQVVASIQFAIEKKLPIIEVFQFKNSDFVITLSEKEFESNLDNIFDFYLEKENYELCTRVVKLREFIKNKRNNEKEKASITGSK